MENFSEIKEFIASRCREKSACSAEFKRLLSSDSFTELLKVLTDNWWWCVNNSIFDGNLLLKFGSEALSACNVTIVDNGYHEATEGYWYADGNSTVSADGNSTVRADGNSTVSADGNSTVSAYGNSTVSADGNSTVSAYGNSTVSAYGNSTVSAYGNSTVRAYGNSTVSAYGNSTVSADGNSTVSAYGNSTVRAYGNSTVSAYGNSTVSADGNSTVRAESRATINSYNSNGHEVKQYSICRYIGDWPEYKVYKVLLGSDISDLIKPAENGSDQG